MRLEEGEAEVELEHDAPHAPNITGLGPAVLCNVRGVDNITQTYPLREAPSGQGKLSLCSEYISESN